MSRVAPTLTRKARIWPGPIPGTHEPGFVEHPIVERERDATFAAIRRMIGGDHIELYAFSMGECNILLGREPGGVNGELRWHLTISCVDRHPTWDEIKTARYRLLGPDTVIAMILPPAADYVNVVSQDHVMQLWEIDDPAFGGSSWCLPDAPATVSLFVDARCGCAECEARTQNAAFVDDAASMAVAEKE